MSHKKVKKSFKHLPTHLLLGIPTNIAAGPLGFRAELDTNPKDKKNPRPSRIEFCERESDLQGDPVQGASTTVAVLDIDPDDRPTDENASYAGQEEDGLVVPLMAPMQDYSNTALGSTTILTNASNDRSSGFGPLKDLLGNLGNISAAYADLHGTIAVRKKVEVLLPHIVSLDVLFATLPSDEEDHSSREELLCEVEDVEKELRSLCENPETQQANHGQDREIVLRLLEGLQEVILRYQMVRQTAINGQGLKNIDSAETDVIDKISSAQQAEYRHGDRDGCLKGTRNAILDEIELWTRGISNPPIYWLNGLAGTGKTTIAQTIAERMFAEGRLGASFFCSRDFEDRSNLKLIFPTLAVRLARTYAEFRSALIPLVRSDSGIAHESLYGQMNKLIVQPLVKSEISTVIVIDALDECKDREPSSAILSILRQFVKMIPKAKFFVTGRPEPHIRDGFRLLQLAEATDVFVLHEVEPNQINSDVRLFFTHNLSELKERRHVQGDWPTEVQMNLLCERSTGFFVHAMATVRFINQKNKNPKKQLNLLLQSPESSFVGGTELKENSTLDSLHLSILQEAFGTNKPEDDLNVQSVLGAVVLATNPLPPSAIASLLSFDAEDIFHLLSSVHSLLVLQEEDIDCPVRLFHKSFPDFITNSARCTNPQFYVCPSDQHANLLVGCLQLMNQRLEQNICGLPDVVINSEVNNLKDRAKEYIDYALEYACRSWHKHLVDKMSTQTLEILHRFLTEKFLFWLEVLSIVGSVREAVDALEVAAKWLDVLSTLDIVRDYSRFVITFFDLISTSAPHIYISALPLSPKMTMVHKIYKQYACPLAKVVHGIPTSWEPVIATVYHGDVSSRVTWSSCNKFIAVAKTRAVEIRDAVTLSLLNTFNSPPGFITLWLSFSSDNCFLIQLTFEDLVIWDLQTGTSIISTLSDGILPTGLCLGYSDSPVYSMDGKVLAAACSNLDTSDPFILTHNLSTKHTHLYHTLEEHLISPIWTHGEFIQFATAKQRSITIWEVGFNLLHPPQVVGCLPAPDEFIHTEAFGWAMLLPTLF